MCKNEFGIDNLQWFCCILTFDTAKYAIPKWCTGRKWHIPMASNRKKSRMRIWLTKWDKVKAHDTFIDRCTGRERPLNCMAVISAWWRSNMPFQRLGGRLNYYITRWERKSESWRADELETRCGRESHTRPKAPSGPRWSLETRWWQDAVEKARTQQSGPLDLRLSSPGEWERHNADGHKSGGQCIAVLFGLQTPSHSKTLSNPFGTLTIKWEVHIFLKKSSLIFIHCVSMYSACICVYKHIYYVSIQQFMCNQTKPNQILEVKNATDLWSKVKMTKIASKETKISSEISHAFQILTEFKHQQKMNINVCFYFCLSGYV